MTSTGVPTLTWRVSVRSDDHPPVGNDIDVAGLADSLVQRLREERIGQGCDDAFVLARKVYAAARRWKAELHLRRPRLLLTQLDAVLTDTSGEHGNDVVLRVDVVGESVTVLRELDGAFSWG